MYILELKIKCMKLRIHWMDLTAAQMKQMTELVNLKKKRTIENIKAEAHRGKRIGTTAQIIKDKFCIAW